jgi:hypothetical protein
MLYVSGLEFYKTSTGKDLSQDLEKTFSGNMKRNVISLLILQVIFLKKLVQIFFHH